MNGCDSFCGMNPVERLKVVWRLFCLLFPHKQKLLMPNIGAFLRCHEKSQKNDKEFASYSLLECSWPHDAAFVTILILGSGLAGTPNYLGTTTVFF